MAADVYTVYFTEHEQRRHVFAATDGLPPELVGQVQAGFGQVLIGQVADSGHPVNMAHVQEELDWPNDRENAYVARQSRFLSVQIPEHPATQTSSTRATTREYGLQSYSAGVWLFSATQQVDAAVPQSRSAGKAANGSLWTQVVTARRQWATWLWILTITEDTRLISSLKSSRISGSTYFREGHPIECVKKDPVKVL